jgi:PST family polysaccharide transporter
MAGALTTLLASVVLALLKFEHWSLIIGSLSSIVIQTVILFTLSNFKPNFIFSFSVLKQMIYFSINSFLEALLAWAASSIILAFVNIKLGNDISGIYKMGNTTVSGIFNTFSAIFITVLFSNLSRQKKIIKSLTMHISIIKEVPPILSFRQL